MGILATSKDLLGGARRIGLAALLRAVAGLPIAPPPRRRGTVLILILGALALLSITTLIYMTIGQGDKRAGQSTRTKADVQGTVDKIGQYFRHVIADETVAVYVDGIETDLGGNIRPVWVRKAFQYPYTDPFRRSIVIPGATANQDDRRFDPSGGYDKADIAGGGVDLRVPGTPFLAMTTPVYIRPANANAAANDYLKQRDWLHITNISPDGRFVNLWNLRNNFDVKSAYVPQGVNGTLAPLSPSLVGRLSYGLVLRKNDGNPTEMLENGTGAVADVNTPAHWADRQFGAFAPATGPMFYPSNMNDPLPGRVTITVNSPGSVWYAPYQWCDADGDGFFDSRWSELVDVTDQNNPLSLLPQDNRFRWFVAARVVDLSSLVNVNTATDFRTPPRAVQDPMGAPYAVGSEPRLPLGVSPSDIDVRRLLTLADVWYQWGFAYNDIVQQIIRPANGTAGDYAAYDGTVGAAVGGFGYDVLRQVLQSNSELVPPAPLGASRPALIMFSGDERAAYYANLAGLPEGGYFLSGGAPAFRTAAMFGTSDLLELFTFWATNDDHSTSRLEQAIDGRLFANARYGPLRSNRPGDLERAVDITVQGGQGSPYLGDGTPDPEAMRRFLADVRHLITTYSLSRPLRPGVVPTTFAPPRTYPQFKNTLDASIDVKVDAREALKKAAKPGSTRDPSVLFKAYAEALMPHAGRGEAWTQPRNRTLFYGYNDVLQARIPELALRITGVVAANAVDAYDKPDPNGTANQQAVAAGPTAFTLLLDESRRGTVTGNALFPWWNEPAGSTGTPPVTTYPGRLDLGAPRLPNGGVQVSANSGAINVYGIEAQPFLTQVTFMALYTDTPLSLGGDSDFSAQDPQGQDHDITISGLTPPALVPGSRPGAPSAETRDFLGQFLAFQITNPFNEPVHLTKYDPTATAASEGNADFTDGQYSDFYVEFSGHYYKLARLLLDPSSTGGTPGSAPMKTVILRPGETRTFIAMTQPPETTRQRWAASSGLTVAQDAVDRFLINQFGLQPTPGMTYDASELDQTTGLLKPAIMPPMENPGTAVSPNPQFSARNQLFPGDLMEPPVTGPSDTEARKVVHLWRVMHTNADLTAPIHNRKYDLLADRLHEPPAITLPNGASPVLDRRLAHRSLQNPGPQNHIVGTRAGDENDPSNINDNTGVVVGLWATLQRRHDPGDGATGVPLGAIPSWCVEAKWTSTALFNDHHFCKGGARLTNPDCRIIYNVPVCAGHIPGQLFNPNAFKDMGSFLSKAAAARNPQVMVPSNVRRRPENWSITGTDPARDMQANLDTSAKAYKDLYPQIHLNNQEFKETLPGPPPQVTLSTLRLSSMLLPMGIGPMQDPDVQNGDTTEPDTVHKGWLTLSEALGLALNYSTPPNVATGAFSTYYKLGDSATGALDRGNLVLDRFAPFEDFNGNGTYEPTGGNPDRPRFPGIPLALNIFNVFSTDDPELGGLTRGIPGKLNINAAPVENLRVLPMFAPTTERNGNNISTWQTWKTWAGVTNQVLPGPASMPGVDDGTDVAASVQANRDKMRVIDRDGFGATFLDSGNPFVPQTWDGRLLTTEIPGISEVPGFMTPGAIMTTIDRSLMGANPNEHLPNFGVNNNARIIAKGDQIDNLGIEHQYPGTPPANNSSIPGLVDTLYPASATATRNTKSDEIKDDWFEKLEIAAGAVNSTTVRSDTFAVWFVVHGYQRSDVEGLGPNDPLVPSVAKRFLMVLDRSNVTHKGDMPRVVLFTELPLAEGR